MSIRRIAEGVSTVAVVIAASAIVYSVFFRHETASAQPAQPPLPTGTVNFERSHSKGSQSAKIGIVEYSDFQCPYCAQAVKQTLPDLFKEFVDSGKVVFAFNHFPLEQIHPLSAKAALMAECGAKQGQFWTVHDFLFSQPKLSEEVLNDVERQSGIDAAALNSCAHDVSVEQAVRQQSAKARSNNVASTPTFLIGTLEGPTTLRIVDVIRGAKPIAAFRASIDRVSVRVKP